MDINRSFKILIADNEPDARWLLKSLLSEFEDVEVVAEAANSEEALYLFVEHSPDLILLDINMPGKSGVDLAKLIRKSNVNLPVVFVSAHLQFAVQAIRNEVYDFLSKPVDRDELKSVIDKYKKQNEKNLPGRLIEVLNSVKTDTKIRIKSKYSYILINPSEIVYCNSDDGYTNIFLNNGKTEVASSSLVQIEELLDGFNFYRLGRSVLINVDYIKTIDKVSNTCTLKYNNSSWEVQTSRKSLNKLLTLNFPNA